MIFVPRGYLVSENLMPFRDEADVGAESLRNDVEMPLDVFRFVVGHLFSGRPDS